MTTTVDAIYEHGKLLLPRPLSLPEKSLVRVTIESGDAERDLWMKLSEESLMKTLVFTHKFFIFVGGFLILRTST